MLDLTLSESAATDPLLTMQQALTLCREMGLTISLRTLENWTLEGLVVVHQPAQGKQKRVRRSEIVRIVNRKAGE